MKTAAAKSSSQQLPVAVCIVHMYVHLLQLQDPYNAPVELGGVGYSVCAFDLRTNEVYISLLLVFDWARPLHIGFYWGAQRFEARPCAQQLRGQSCCWMLAIREISLWKIDYSYTIYREYEFYLLLVSGSFQIPGSSLSWRRVVDAGSMLALRCARFLLMNLRCGDLWGIELHNV